MKTYRNIEVDYGVNKGIIDEYYRELEARRAYEQAQQEGAQQKTETIDTQAVQDIINEDQMPAQDPEAELADDMGIIHTDEE